MEQTKRRMRLRFLGTGTSTGVPVVGCRCRVCTSADPRDRRLRCSSLLDVEDASAADGFRHILLDCSPDFREQMLRAGFCRLDAVFITHEHYDHVGGLDDLRPYSVFGDVRVYAEPFCAEHLRERIPYCFTPKRVRYAGVPAIDLVEIQPHEPVRVGEVEVLPIRLMHGRLPILGYRIGGLGYLTDLSWIADEELALLEGLDMLVLDGLRHEPHPSHETIEEALQVSERLGCPETYLIHMSHHVLPHADEEKRLPPHAHLAYDGLCLEF